MEEGSTKNGWDFTSRDPALFTRQQLRTVPTRTALQNGQIERLWNESRLSLQKQNSTNDFGWKSQIQSSTSKIAAQQLQSPLPRTNYGMASNQTCLISRSSDQQHMFTFRRKSASNSTPTLTRELWSVTAAAQTSTRYGISQGRMLWCQGMWYSSKESQSIKLRQSTSKNQGSCTIRLQSCQDRQQKPKSHNKSYLRLRHRNIQIRKSQSQRQSTQGFYCKNRRQWNLKNQQPAERSADQQAESRHKGHRRDRTKGPSPPRNSRTKTSTKHHEFAWQRLHGTSIPTTRTNRQQFNKLSTIPHARNSGRKPFETFWQGNWRKKSTWNNQRDSKLEPRRTISCAGSGKAFTD